MNSASTPDPNIAGTTWQASPRPPAAGPQLIVVQNWFEELRRLVPTN